MDGGAYSASAVICGVRLGKLFNQTNQTWVNEQTLGSCIKMSMCVLERSLPKQEGCMFLSYFFLLHWFFWVNHLPIYSNDPSDQFHNYVYVSYCLG